MVNIVIKPLLGDVNYFIDHDKQLLYVTRLDALTLEGVYSEWKGMQQMDGFNSSYKTLVDYSLVPRFDLNVTDIMQIKKDIKKYDPRTGKVAIVTGMTYGRYLLAKFFCQASNLIYQRKHWVFQTRAEAEAWLMADE